MDKQDTSVLTSKAPGHLYIEGAFHGQGRTSHDTGKAGDRKYGHSDEYVDDARAQKSYDGDGKQDIREAE